MMKDNTLLAEAGIILEALNSSVKWELCPEIKEQIEQTLSEIRKEIKSTNEGIREKIFSVIVNLVESILYDEGLTTFRDIKKAIDGGIITTDEIVKKFKECFTKEIKEPQ